MHQNHCLGVSGATNNDFPIGSLIRRRDGIVAIVDPGAADQA
jgi:hypothetical protein